MKYTVYETATGNIVKWGECPDEDIDAQADPATQRVWEGDAFSDATHSFVGGKPVEVPSAKSRADIDTAVNDERARRILVGTVINGVYVTGDKQTADNLRSLAFKAERRQRDGDDTQIVYRDGVNALHLLTPTEFMAVYDEADAYVEEAYFKSWQIKAMQPPPADIASDALWPARTLPEM